MPSSRLPPPRPLTGDDARKRFLLQAVMTLLVVTAVLILVLPLRLPRPLRIAVAGIDLIAASVIWLLGRQRYGR